MCVLFTSRKLEKKIGHNPHVFFLVTNIEIEILLPWAGCRSLSRISSVADFFTTPDASVNKTAVISMLASVKLTKVQNDVQV